LLSELQKFLFVIYLLVEIVELSVQIKKMLDYLHSGIENIDINVMINITILTERGVFVNVKYPLTTATKWTTT
jgi:hypothetical protein